MISQLELDFNSIPDKEENKPDIPQKKKMIWLSPSKLNVFLECPKCFWLSERAGIHRPRGIFPSLPGGMDTVIKIYFDKYRKSNILPPEVEGLPGKLLPDQKKMDFWRNWKTGLMWIDDELGVKLIGALDDCLLVDDKYYVPIDYKTKGTEPAADSFKYYQNQLNCYNFLFEKNNLPHLDEAYLVYYSPNEVSSGGQVKFNVNTIKVKTSVIDAFKTIKAALDLLDGDIPERHSGCEYCAWGNDYY